MGWVYRNISENERAVFLCFLFAYLDIGQLVSWLKGSVVLKIWFHTSVDESKHHYECYFDNKCKYNWNLAQMYSWLIGAKHFNCMVNKYIWIWFLLFRIFKILLWQQEVWCTWILLILSRSLAQKSGQQPCYCIGYLFLHRRPEEIV